MQDAKPLKYTEENWFVRREIIEALDSQMPHIIYVLIKQKTDTDNDDELNAVIMDHSEIDLNECTYDELSYIIDQVLRNYAIQSLINKGDIKQSKSGHLEFTKKGQRRTEKVLKKRKIDDF
jgi:acyl-CoA-binding protein